MELQIKKGDLLKEAQENEFTAIAHGCNCRVAMASGIARSIAIRWPQVIAADIQHAAVYDPDKMLGTLSYTVAYVPSRYKFTIFNLYTQLDPGANFDPDAFGRCLDILDSIFENCSSNVHIGFPWIGCGIGGGDKDVVLGIIKNRIKHIPKLTIIEYDESN